VRAFDGQRRSVAHSSRSSAELGTRSPVINSCKPREDDEESSNPVVNFSLYRGHPGARGRPI
jgi:hypothetical protein